jgi:hypothetical protein
MRQREVKKRKKRAPKKEEWDKIGFRIPAVCLSSS